MPIYSDLSFSLEKTTFKDISLKTDLESVKQSIKNIVLTHRGSRTIFQNPEFGSNVHKLLFEKMNNITSIQIQQEIYTAIENFEPRVEIIEITVVPDYTNLRYTVNILYNLVNLSIEYNLNLNLDVIK